MGMSLAVQAGGHRPAAMQFPIKVPADEVMQLRKKLTGEGSESYIVLSPGGGWKSKCWPAERFGALCAQMWQRNGIRCVINLAPGEEQLGKEVIASSFSAKPI